MIVFSTPSSLRLSERIARARDWAVGSLNRQVFPDGEVYLQVLSDVVGKECAAVCSPLSNDDLVEFFILLDVLRDLGASRVHAVVPYMMYARQDRRFKEGEALSAKTVVKTMGCLSDSITTVNCHFIKVDGTVDFHGTGIRNLDAFPLLIDYYKDKFANPVAIAPDKGSLDYVRNAAGTIGCEFDFLHKRRLSGTEVVMETKSLDVSGKDVIILDDMISTGGTMIEAAKMLKNQGAASVNVGCVHGVFSKGAERIRSSVDSLVCTDTIQRDESRVSVAGIIGATMRPVDNF